MNSRYLFELASGFWLNVSAGYFFLAVPFSASIFDRINSLFFCIACFMAAYYCRKRSEERS